MQKISITKKNSGGRLDRLLFKYLPKAPSGFIYKMLRKKNIVLNDKKAAGGEILSDGDVITLYLSDETIKKFKGEKEPGLLRSGADADNFKKLIVYEDDNIIVMNKPQGLLSQKARPGDISLNDMLISYLGKDETFTPGVANRLDRNTEGLVVAGKNLLSSRLLSEAVKKRSFKKLYLALCMGDIEEEAVLKGYIIKDVSSNFSKVIPADDDNIPSGAKYVKTAVKPLVSNKELTLIQAELATGRSHQIRVQTANAGHPLAGDRKYGSEALNRRLKKSYGLKRQFLCAYVIEFTDMEGELSYLNGKKIQAPLSKEFEDILKGENLWQPGLQEALEAPSSRK